MMSKNYFWPLTLIIFGAIFSGTFLGMMPMHLIIVWPILMLIVGLGGLVTADRVEWLVPIEKKTKKSSSSANKKK